MQLAPVHYAAQLVLNLAWPLADIVALVLLVVATTIAFWRIETAAGWPLAPYLRWLVFATSPNPWIVLMN